MDPQTQALDLSSTLLSASAPPQIASAVSSVDTFLRRHPADQSRPFFSSAFPSLLCKLFGFDSSPSPQSSAWIDHPEPDIASSLFALLSPGGPLFAAVAAVDRNYLVRYVFPPERLPEWMRHVLANEQRRSAAVLAELCPILRGRLKEDPLSGAFQLQLNVFEYYFFWFAYYPVCKGSSGENSIQADARRTERRFKLENWTASWPASLGSGRRQRGQTAECSLYLKLLYSYLHVFVPKVSDLSSSQPYRSSLLHYSSSHDGTALLQAEFLVYTFVHFWLVDNDFSPLPVSLCQSFGLSFPFRKAMCEVPPTPGLGEVLMLLVKYLNSSSMGCKESVHSMEVLDTPVHNTKSQCLSSEELVGPWNTILRRPLYRFILRTFLFCPMGTSISNAAQVFSLWTSYLEPWKISEDDFVEYDPQKSQNKVSLSSPDSRRSDPCDSPYWQGYVVSNYLFYSLLLVHFLGFAHKFLHTNAETIIQMVLKVMSILTSSKELTDILKKVDAGYRSKSAASSATTLDSFSKFTPSIREKLLDWEDGLCETDADGSFLHENWNHELRLFSDGDNGAHQLLQLLILRAEHEIKVCGGENETQSLQNLASLRRQMNVLFGGPVSSSLSPVRTKCSSSEQLAHDELFTPKHPGVGKRTWADVKYKGDWMRRPISDSEVAWLARHLVRLSDWLNELMRLNRRRGCDESAVPNYIEVPSSELNSVHSVKDAVCMLLTLLWSWLSFLVKTSLRITRERGWRINLRVFASKKVVMVLLAFALLSALRKAFGIQY